MVKTLSQTSVAQGTATTCSSKRPIRVCMYVRGTARTDVRVMREATALVDAGFAVSVVDVVAGGKNLPIEEEINGVRVKHIVMPGWFVPTRFKPWFLVEAARMLIRSTLRLMRESADIYHAHDDTGLTACYIAARLCHKPLIFDAHEIPLLQRPLSEMSRRHRWLHMLSTGLFALIVPPCAGIITVSPPIVREIRKRYRVSEVSLIRNIPSYRSVQKSDR